MSFSNHASSTETTYVFSKVLHFFSELISMFFLDMLHIPSGYIEICSGYLIPTCTPCLRAFWSLYLELFYRFV